MRRPLLTLIVLSLALFLATLAAATVPFSINLQGRLTDAAGQPIGEQELRFDFKIFNAEADGIEIWPKANETGERHTIIPDAQGLWNTAIGTRYALSPEVFTDRSEIDDSTRWLQITIDGQTLPRVRLISGPYAMKVGSIDGAVGGDIYGNINLHSQLKVGDEVGDVGLIKVTDGSQTTITLEGSTGNIIANGKATIGPLHTNTGANGFAAGYSTTVTADDATASGGADNIVSGSAATVSGGTITVPRPWGPPCLGAQPISPLACGPPPAAVTLT